VQTYALAYPQIHFIVVHNGSQILNAPPSTLQQRIGSITSHSVAQQLTYIPPLSYNEITVQGFTSQSSLYRKDKRLQYFFINNRAVQSTMLNSAMSRAYDQVIHHGFYPVCVLF